GRDVLIGCAAGVLLSVAVRTTGLLLGPSIAGGVPPPIGLEPIHGTLPFFGTLFQTLQMMVLLAFGQLFLLFFLRTLVRNEWIAVGVYVALWALPDAFNVPTTNMWVVVAIDVFFYSVFLAVLMRFGLTSFVVTWFMYQVVQWRFPMTFQGSVW